MSLTRVLVVFALALNMASAFMSSGAPTNGWVRQTTVLRAEPYLGVVTNNNPNIPDDVFEKAYDAVVPKAVEKPKPKAKAKAKAEEPKE